MLRLAFKNLIQDKIRLLISVFGVSFSLLLILTLLGIYRGALEQATMYIDSIDADIWVAQEGTHDMFHTFSLLPVNIEGKLNSFREIEKAYPFISRTTAFKLRGVENNVSLIGIDEDHDIGKPTKIVTGYDLPEKDEIIVDEITMSKNNFSLGDVIRFGSDEEEDYEDLDEYKIVGVSKDTNILVFQYAFINFEDAQKLLGTDQAVNFYIVRTKPGVDIEKLKTKIERRIDNSVAFTKEEFSDNNGDLVRDSFLPILSIIVIIGFIIGIAIIGLIIYTATIEKTREYGILKAIGISNFRLYIMVIQQALIISLFGYLLTLLLSQITEYFIESLKTGVRVTILQDYYMFVFYSCLAMAIVSAYIPIRRINKIDPAIVFKS